MLIVFAHLPLIHVHQTFLHYIDASNIGVCIIYDTSQDLVVTHSLVQSHNYEF